MPDYPNITRRPRGLQDTCDFPVEKIVYVMTDFTESNFKFWAEHPVSDALGDLSCLEGGGRITSAATAP